MPPLQSFFILAKTYILNSIYYFSGEDAYKKIRAGASLIQLYTAFAYGGPALIPQIKVSVFTHFNNIM